jgi:hypothetical protein
MSADSECCDIGQTEVSLNENKHQIVYNFTINFIEVSIARSYGLDGWGSIPSRGKIFLSSTASRPTLGPTQPPIIWVPETISLGVNRPGRKADHSPVCLHGIVFN